MSCNITSLMSKLSAFKSVLLPGHCWGLFVVTMLIVNLLHSKAQNICPPKDRNWWSCHADCNSVGRTLTRKVTVKSGGEVCFLLTLATYIPINKFWPMYSFCFQSPSAHPVNRRVWVEGTSRLGSDPNLCCGRVCRRMKYTYGE